MPLTKLRMIFKRPRTQPVASCEVTAGVRGVWVQVWEEGDLDQGDGSLTVWGSWGFVFSAVKELKVRKLPKHSWGVGRGLNMGNNQLGEKGSSQRWENVHTAMAHRERPLQHRWKTPEAYVSLSSRAGGLRVFEGLLTPVWTKTRRLVGPIIWD